MVKIAAYAAAAAAAVCAASGQLPGYILGVGAGLVAIAFWQVRDHRSFNLW